MSLRKSWIHTERSVAVVFRLLHAQQLRFEVVADLHRDVRQRSVCQREFGVALDGSRQVLIGDSESFFSVGVTLAKTLHEFIKRFRVSAVPIARLLYRPWKPGLQRFHNSAPNFVLYVEDAFQH